MSRARRDVLKKIHPLFGGVRVLPRQLSLKETFFLGIGGQSPLLSLFAYGIAVVGITSLVSPIVMILGTVLVLLNGLVVNRLASRYDASGGYYTYAFNALSRRLGFQTGWLYVFYSVLYGSAYVFASAFLLRTVFGLPVVFGISVVVLPALALLLFGIKPSSKYAQFAAMAEIAILVATFVSFSYQAHFVFYNPVSQLSGTAPGKIALGILLAAAIPTGYGTLAPISGEIVDAHRNVGKSVVYIIATGGLLAILFVYSVMNVYVARGLPLDLSLNGAHVIGTVSLAFGFATVPVIAFAALSDGILSVLAFMTAASRTVYKMGYDGVLPSTLARVRGSRPLVASLVVGAAYLAIAYVLSSSTDPFSVFLGLGIVAGMAGLVTHIAANASLIRIALGNIGGRLTVSRAMHILEVALGAVAAAFSASDLAFSFSQVIPIFIYAFMVWIIAGYVYADVREMVGEVQPEAEKATGEEPVKGGR
jgi:amino acid transporter